MHMYPASKKYTLCVYIIITDKIIIVYLCLRNDVGGLKLDGKLDP